MANFNIIFENIVESKCKPFINNLLPEDLQRDLENHFEDYLQEDEDFLGFGYNHGYTIRFENKNEVTFIPNGVKEIEIYAKGNPRYETYYQYHNIPTDGKDFYLMISRDNSTWGMYDCLSLEDLRGLIIEIPDDSRPVYLRIQYLRDDNMVNYSNSLIINRPLQ